MARDHARLLISIWDDPDWVSLDSSSQTVYSSLISSRDLSWCGVAPLLPQRIIKHARDLNERKVKAAFGDLTARRMLLIDHDTAEILVRTYVRHDGILKQPNITKALVRAMDRVHSAPLIEALKVELSVLLSDEPSLRGWDVIRSGWPDLFTELLANPSANPSVNPSRKAG